MKQASLELPNLKKLKPEDLPTKTTLFSDVQKFNLDLQYAWQPDMADVCYKWASKVFYQCTRHTCQPEACKIMVRYIKTDWWTGYFMADVAKSLPLWGSNNLLEALLQVLLRMCRRLHRMPNFLRWYWHLSIPLDSVKVFYYCNRNVYTPTMC